MDAAITTFRVSLGDAERWERIAEDLATLLGIYFEKALKTAWSYTKKAGTSWWPEGGSLARILLGHT